MHHPKLLYCIMLALVAGLGPGCVRAAKDTTGFALKDEVTIEAPFDETWQAVKHVLREHDLEIYTRDKRGRFVAYSDMRRRLLVPHRTKYTIELMDISPEETAMHIETVRQVYGVTLLTYPDWHARQAKDNDKALELLAAVEATLDTPPEEQDTTGDLTTVEASPAS